MGWPSVEWGLRQISSSELTEWAVFVELEGLPEINAELRAAKALYAFVNAHRDTEKRRSEYPLEEFLPDWLKEDEAPINNEDGAPIDPRVARAAENAKTILGAYFR